MTILVFDSGIGGLGVLREARVLMPHRRFVYVADDAGFPYGGWSEARLSARLETLFGDLLARFKPQIAIIACNTASTLAIERLRERFPDQLFVGTVPAIKPAAERTRSGLVSVLATPGTIRRQYTRDLIRQYAAQCHVRLVGSTVLAELAERYMFAGHVDEAQVAGEIAPCFVEQDGRRTDIIVLACTHYPFLANRMRKTAPWPVDWIDPAEAIARRAQVLAQSEKLAPDDDREPDIAVFTSGAAGEEQRRLMRGFGLMTDCPPDWPAPRRDAGD